MTIAFVQSNGKDAGTVTSTTLAFNSNVTAASLLLATVRANTTTGVTVSDNVNAGNYALDVTNTGTSGVVLNTLSKPNAGAGATTVTISLGALAALRVAIDEFSGLATSTPLDQTNNGTGTSTSASSGNVTTTQASELLFSSGGSNTNDTVTATSSFTLDQSVPAAPNARAWTQYLIVSSTGTYSSTSTLSATSSWGLNIATYKASGVAAAPFIPIDLDERITTKVLPSDFSPPNLLAQQTLKLPPFTQKELPGWAIGAKGVYTDFSPPNLLTQGTLKLPPFTQSNDGARTFWNGVYTDFQPPNLLAAKFLPPPPVATIDLSQHVQFKWSATDFSPPNLLITILPAPPTIPGDPTTGIRIKGIYTDFAAPNLILNTLAPPPPAPLLPQDISGIRLDAKSLRSDFIPPNLTLTLPVAPPPVTTGAGRHKSRQEAHRRHQRDVLRAQLEAFKEQRRAAEEALENSENREARERAKVLKRIRVKATRLKKPLEQYAPVKRAIVQRNTALHRYRDILQSLERAQAAHEQVERELRAADEDAALHLMQFLMWEADWRE